VRTILSSPGPRWIEKRGENSFSLDQVEFDSDLAEKTLVSGRHMQKYFRQKNSEQVRIAPNTLAEKGTGGARIQQVIHIMVKTRKQLHSCPQCAPTSRITAQR
jgi:hypothetical protein